MRLVARLTKIGEPERVLEFHSARDGVRVVGSAANADVVLSDPGVLPVHCYFELHYGELWLLPAQEGSELRVNYQPISGPVKLPGRSIVEIGEARLQVAIVEREETSALHGPFGTEIIDISTRASSGDRVQAALDELPTGHWQRPDLSGGVLVTADLPLVTPDEAVTLEYRLPSRMPLEGVASIDEPTSAVPSASLDVLTTTVRMPRAAPKSSEAEPVRPTACIQVVSERGIASAGGTLASFRRQGEEVTLPNGTPCVLAAPIVDRRCPVPSEEHRREHSLASNFRERNPAFDAMAFPRGNPPQALALPPALRPQPAKARPSYATPRPKQSFRLRFATTLGRDRKIVASVMIAAALSVSAFVAQAVRAWPYIATIARGVSHPPSPHVVAGRLATKLTAIPKAK